MSGNTPFQAVDSDVSPALLPLASQQAVSISTTVTAANTPSGTAFPAAPANGDGFIYTADATNGIKWSFQYDSSQTTYKWVCVGGLPMFASVATNETTTSSTYAALSTAGPSIIVPLAGDYIVYVSVEVSRSGGAATTEYGAASYDIGGTGAADVDRVTGLAEIGGTGIATTASRSKAKTALAAATTLTMKYRMPSNAGGTIAFAERTMMLLPIRVSG